MNSEIVAGAGSAVASVQVIQDVYNKLTGRTEVAARFFFDAHLVEISDLRTLHKSLEAAIEQYQCTASSCFVSVKYSDGKSERFSGFARFEKFGVERSIATVEVELEYDFLILLPKTQEPKPYKVEIGIRSGIGIVEGFRLTDTSETEKEMYFQIKSGTARLEIHYVDLAVSKALEATVEDWYRGLRKRAGSSFLKSLRQWNSAVPTAMRLLLLITTLAAGFALTSSLVSDYKSLFAAGVSLFGAVSVVSLLGAPIGNSIRKSIDRSGPLSAICLSKVDDELMKKSNSSGKVIAFKAVLSVVGTIVLGLVSAYIGSLLGIN